MQVTLPTADVLCLYGLPDHELYEQLLHWLDESSERFLVVLEDDPNILKLPYSKHERIYLCDAQDEERLKKVMWELVFLKIEYLQVPGNSSKVQKKMTDCFEKIAFLQEGIHLVASDFQERGVNLLSNFLKNQSRSSEFREGRNLFGAFSKTPAIICGAGSSIEKDVMHLNALKDKALVFAGGSALTCLSQYGIQPHFGAAVDPYDPPNRLFAHQAFQVPFFFQMRVHPRVLEQMQGPLLHIPGGQNDLLEEASFEGGWNVATFLVALAYELGCNPIILAGVDLSQSSESERMVPLEDGKYTKRDWLFAADWLSNFAKKHQEVEWINTSSGLEIEGFLKQDLTQLHLKQSLDLSAEVHSHITGVKQCSSICSKPLEKSFKKVRELCVEMLELLEEIFPDSVETHRDYRLLAEEVEKETAYTRFLLPTWEVWKNVFIRQIPKDIPPEYGIELNRWLFIKGICDDARQI